MLRFKILVSVVPLMVAALFARIELVPVARPCIEVGDQSVQIASAPWQAGLHVGFTDDPTAATVRVEIADSAEAADFAVVDDIDSAEDNACKIDAATQFIAISAKLSGTRPSGTRTSGNKALGTAPVIYLTHEGPADYRIFVNSKTFTAREAAALIVGASGGHSRLTAASL
jgi:hypothetical protein